MGFLWLWFAFKGHSQLFFSRLDNNVNSFPSWVYFNWYLSHLTWWSFPCACTFISVSMAFLSGFQRQNGIGKLNWKLLPSQVPIQSVRPRGLTFSWWGCCGFSFRHWPAELAHSFLFCSCVYFCLYGSFNCISFHKFSRQLSAFSLYSSSPISALLVLSVMYISLGKSPSSLI